jgi:hypothetical protein
MPEDKKFEIKFAPGCFDNFDGTQEELDALIAELHSMVESGDLLKNSRPVTDEEAHEIFHEFGKRDQRQ